MTIKSENHHDCTPNKSFNDNNNGGLARDDVITDGLFTEDEIEVGNILLDLPYLITKSLSSCRFPYNWNTKKRRSALVSPPSPPPCKVAHSTPVKGEEASSPTTPLSFSPSESDSKFKPSSRKRKAPGLNSRKEDLEKAVRERLLTQQQLQEALAKVKEHWNMLMAENSELKAKKPELLMMNNFGEKRRRDKIMTACTTQMQQQHQQQTTPVNDLVHPVPSTSTEFHHQIPLIFSHQLPHGVNDSVYAGPSSTTQFLHHGPLINGRPSVVVSNPVGVGPSSSAQFHYPGPLIPHQQFSYLINQADQHDPVFRRRRQDYQFDLNMVPDEEYTRMNQINKAMAAAARKNRIHANKEKKTRGKP